MLGYLARTVPPILRSLRHRDGALVSRLQRRVRLSEVDYNLHMNQAAYAQVMEIGRTDWAIRSGAWDRCRSRGVYPVVAEQRIVYRRELKPLTAYTVDTRTVEQDGRLVLCESNLVVGDRVHALGEVWMIFVGERGVLSPDEVAELAEPWMTERLRVRRWRVVS